MRDALPFKPHVNECGIVNLDTSFGLGTHWVCYRKRGVCVEYYDSFGNLRPPPELVRYFGVACNVSYNYSRQQSFGSVVCGHLCLQFLSKNVLCERGRFYYQH